MATIKDVAKEATVSIATVSHVINRTRYVSPELTERVKKGIERLDYHRNKIARSLKTQRTYTIGLIVSDISNPFFGALAKGVERAAREFDYSVILQNTDEDYDREKEAIQTLLAEQVDGLLITPTQKGQETIEALKESDFPFVLIGRYFDDLETDYVVTDDVQGGFLATEHLIKLGHEKIAMINGPLYISSAAKRFQGYQKALGHYGIEMDESMLSAAGAITIEDGYKAARALLQGCPRPTAIFAFSDFVAFGTMKAIREAELRIPEDVAVVGYDDIEFASCLEIPLTTVRIATKRVGEESLKFLNKKITEVGRRWHYREKLKTKIVVRESTQLRR